MINVKANIKQQSTKYQCVVGCVLGGCVVLDDVVCDSTSTQYLKEEEKRQDAGNPTEVVLVHCKMIYFRCEEVFDDLASSSM